MNYEPEPLTTEEILLMIDEKLNVLIDLFQAGAELVEEVADEEE
jgi:hypothetical protein